VRLKSSPLARGKRGQVSESHILAFYAPDIVNSIRGDGFDLVAEGELVGPLSWSWPPLELRRSARRGSGEPNATANVLERTGVERDFTLDLGYSESQMRLRSAQPLLVILILTGYMLSVGGLPGASVLCYGADGHVALEPAGTPCATPSGDGSLSPDSGRGVADATSVSCIDIPVSTKTDNLPASRSLEERSTVAKAVLLAVLFSHADAFVPTARISPLSFVAFPANDSRAALRTIILLV